jgi:SOS-response transcriptional repressor LexA
MLTTQLVYDYIMAHYLARGISPTLREIGAGVGLRSSNTAYVQVRKLVRLGLVVMVSRRPIPVQLLAYLKLFTPKKEIVR